MWCTWGTNWKEMSTSLVYDMQIAQSLHTFSPKIEILWPKVIVGTWSQRQRKSIGQQSAHTYTHSASTRGKSVATFPAGLCRWGLSALFSPEGLGLSFCSGTAEFNWRTLMHSWIALLLLPRLPLKLGGRESRTGVCVCVCVCVRVRVSSRYCRPPSWFCQIYSLNLCSLFMSRLIYKIIGNNKSSRLILG